MADVELLGVHGNANTRLVKGLAVDLLLPGLDLVRLELKREVLFGLFAPVFDRFLELFELVS